MNKNTNKLQVKDLVTIGIFSAIYFVINLIVMVSGGITPLLWIFMPPILKM
ncbi:MAG: MptD family putative ECF transporter S component [Lachnospiraceae bacterium]|nr:MptD family putative ECF transporter S component [Lachnospiraceae bacterium]